MNRTQPVAGRALMGKMDAQEKKWRTEEDLRTLANAEEIKRDPERMKACKLMAKQRMTDLESVVSSSGAKAKG